MAPRRRRVPRRVVRRLSLALVPTTMGVAGGCSLANDAVSGVTAPVGALPASDVIVETNLKGALSSSALSLPTGLGVTGAGGPGFVSGPSTGPEVTSSASLGTAGRVLVAWNDVDHHCLGILDVSGPLAMPVLGESSPGTYYFVQTATPSSGCQASLFAAMPTKPASWPAGDPSSSNWPS